MAHKSVRAMTPKAIIKTTTQEQKKLAWMALQHKLHTGDLLEKELLNFLWDKYDHAVALTYVDGEPACVVLAAQYGQLMAFTKPKFRRMGLAKRTTAVLCRRIGAEPKDFNGGPGRKPELSEAFFRSIGANFVK